MLAGAAQAGDPVAVLPVAYHLLWQRELNCDLSVLLGRGLDDVAGGMGEAGAEGIGAGDRVVIDGQPRVVLGAWNTRSSSPATTASSRRRQSPSWRAAAGCGGRAGGRAPGSADRAARPAAGMVERARWWEDHIIEVVDGTRPDVPAGTPPRPEYDVERTTLREREQAKAAELSTPDRPVSASTVRHRRQRWQAEGLPGLVDRRVTRRGQARRP